MQSCKVTASPRLVSQPAPQHVPGLCRNLRSAGSSWPAEPPTSASRSSSTFLQLLVRSPVLRAQWPYGTVHKKTQTVVVWCIVNLQTLQTHVQIHTCDGVFLKCDFLPQSKKRLKRPADTGWATGWLEWQWLPITELCLEMKSWY